MALTGQHIIATELPECAEKYFSAFNPVTGERLQPDIAEGTSGLVDIAAQLAERDFSVYRHLPRDKRATLLLAIAQQLLVIKDELLARAHLETGLSLARLEGELTRTLNQWRLFAEFIRSGDFLQPQFAPALPERQPQPRIDLRLTQVPLGPVAVFGASNFPLAFSVAGGDTVAALAAGCPVIVKGHPAHPGTCELAGRAIRQAIDDCALPGGIFSLIQGSGDEVGAALVLHPLVMAVAFTGSHAGGRALFDLAAARPEPIPVFAEMGSVNPIFLLPQMLQEQGERLAHEYADALTLGVGQFCTNPGLLFVIDNSALESFIVSVQQHLGQVPPAAMLHRVIKRNYQSALRSLANRPGVELLTGDSPETEDCFVLPALLKTSADRFLADPQIGEEVFGPSTVIVVCYSFLQMQQCADALRGQLTATVQALPAEEGLSRELFFTLERKAGRLLLNSFPTGVEVCQAMVHGGPYPATTDSRSSSVGNEAIRRFLRSICYQNFSSSLLPSELQD